jgi:hypothetical protein
MSEPNIINFKPIEGLTLVYKGESGDLHYQPATDLPEAGTLVDPDTDEDMELVGFILK